MNQTMHLILGLRLAITPNSHSKWRIWTQFGYLSFKTFSNDILVVQFEPCLLFAFFPKDLGHFKILIPKTIPIWKCLGFTSFALSQLVGVCLNPRTPLWPTPFYLFPSFGLGPIFYLKACNFFLFWKNTLLSFLKVGFKHNLGSLHVLHHYHILKSNFIFFHWFSILFFCNVEIFGYFIFISANTPR